MPKPHNKEKNSAYDVNAAGASAVTSGYEQFKRPTTVATDPVEEKAYVKRGTKEEKKAALKAKKHAEMHRKR